MNGERSETRALVLGGGGALGMGWEVGLVTGLADGGVDFGHADLLAGTSSGSLVAAHLALGLELAGALQTVAAFGAALGSGSREIDPAGLADAMAKATASETPEAGLRLLGQLATETETLDEDTFLGLFPQLAGQRWPAAFSCAAIDIATGERRVWDATSGVPLQRAVASSTAVPLTLPPVTINGRRYLDGGLRDPLNADLGAGHDRIVAISCFPLGSADGDDATASVTNAAVRAGVDRVRRRARSVALIEPGPEFLEISGGGANVMDPTRVGDAYTAGIRQARAELDRIRATWTG
ncbi:patatin-like phospholipase family protein [Lentzea sp. CC55]|uniref:patatin-like phospholipase family protein n=1 Tax=Lentzea sp. CC55 TaxID=2884909 RepID=UPI001F3AC0D8|nr:patatin-like phospholipase family protein [Lentzea sp. CC55]MCG8922823.1 patatin-like phospholipase family protein [Lentzea sp. CC55]